MIKPKNGYPAGPTTSYKCFKCGDVLPFRPKNGIGCKCGNIFIDVDAGKLSIEDHADAEIVRTQGIGILSKIFFWLN